MSSATADYPPILVAEDEESDLFLLTRACQRAAIPNPLITVRDGEGILHYLTHQPPFQDRERHPAPGLILVDLKMPRMTGFDVLTWLRQQPEFRDLTVVVLSSSDHGPDRRKALELGASEYRVKPSGPDDLTQMMKELQARWLAVSNSGLSQA